MDEHQQIVASTSPVQLNRTPPSSLERTGGSPPNRPRLAQDTDTDVAQRTATGGDILMQDAKTSHHNLRDIPLPLLLLILANDLHSQATILHPTLTRKPSSSSSIARYTHACSLYAKLVTTAVTCLRVVIDLCANSPADTGTGARIHLKARCLLADCLINLTGSSGQTRREAEMIINQGLILSDKHDSLRVYKPYLVLLQVALQLKPTNQGIPPSRSDLRYSRLTLRRFLDTLIKQETTSAAIPLSAAWIYHFQVTLASLPGTPYAEALSCWREIEQRASPRGDRVMRDAARIAIAQLALARGEWTTVKVTLDELQFAASQLACEQETTVTAQAQEPGDKEDISMGPPQQPQVQQLSRLLPSSLQIHWLLIEALYHAHMGQVKLAKDKLKLAHQLLDAPETNDEIGRGEKQGWVRIPFQNSSNVSISRDDLLPRQDSIVIRVPARSAVYTFAFLASVAIHRDPYGSKPRATLFATEGLKLIDASLTGSAYLAPLTTPAQVPSALLSLARIKIHKLLFAAELAIMRSSFALAESHLLSAITTCRQYSRSSTTGQLDLWLEFKSRITLDMGLLAQAKGDDQRAEDCFETVLMEDDESSSTRSTMMKVSRSRSISPTVKRKRSGTAISISSRRQSGGTVLASEDSNAGLDEETLARRIRSRAATCLLAKLSLLVLKIGQGYRVRLSTSTSVSLSSSGGQSQQSAPLSEQDARLTALAQQVVRICTVNDQDQSADQDPTSTQSQSSNTPPSLQLISHFISALTKGEITKAKSHLSQALNLANTTLANHVKCLMLALLANLFLWTRNDQAQKMLNAAFLISRGMGARPSGSGTDSGVGVGDEVVGAARLGLWVGQRLLESYKRQDPSKVAQQEAINAAHRRVLEGESAELLQARPS